MSRAQMRLQACLRTLVAAICSIGIGTQMGLADTSEENAAYYKLDWKKAPSDYHWVLLHGLSSRGFASLPDLIGMENERRGFPNVVRVPLPTHFGAGKEKAGRRAVTMDDFMRLRTAWASEVTDAQARALILQAKPYTDIGYARVRRIGNWIADVSFPGLNTCVISGRLRACLSEVPGFRCYPVVIERIVNLPWMPGDRPPLRGTEEPEDLINRRHHDPELARKTEIHELYPFEAETPTSTPMGGVVRYSYQTRNRSVATIAWREQSVAGKLIFVVNDMNYSEIVVRNALKRTLEKYLGETAVLLPLKPAG